ncbi:MAG: hypothetical protein NTZ52_08065 [Chlamydiae bacterium]|nr:hypothetical protein [Chlamydiota bacterium]
MMKKSERQKRIEEYKVSGLSIHAWCKIQGIHTSIFHYHLKKLSNQDLKKFIELKPISQGIKLRWKNITLELDPEFDGKTLLRFLTTLR